MPITEEHFATYDWKQVIAKGDPSICTEYNRLFRERAELAREESNQEADELFSFLQFVTFLHLDPGAEDDTFPHLSEIRETNIAALASIFSQIEDAEFRARVGDILWIRRIGDKPHTRSPRSTLIGKQRSILKDSETTARRTSG